MSTSGQMLVRAVCQGQLTGGVAGDRVLVPFLNVNGNCTVSRRPP